MSIAVELPELGESIHEGTVSRWLVKVGDVVEVDQPLVEVTTDKVDAEIPSPAAGVVEKILADEGDVVEVGAQLAMLNPDVGASVEPSRSSGPSAASPGEPVGADLSDTPSRSADSPTRAQNPSGEPASTPLARRVAEQRGIEVGEVAGTGVAGRVTRADIVAHEKSAPPAVRAEVASDASAPAAAQRVDRSGRTERKRRPNVATYFDYQPREGDRVIPMSPQRKLIAAHMVYSKHTSPHVGTVAEIDMSAVGQVRAQHKARFESDHGIKLTFLPFIVYATVRALREFPALNAAVADDAIIERRDINIGMAVETEKGLLVPVIRNADRLSLSGLAAAIDDLSSRARNKKLSVDELRGGSFTISNPGRQGNLYGFAIINQPQVGILRMGEMVKRPVVREIAGEDAIVVRSMMHLALSYDHRAVDGAPANGFLFRVRELLEAAEFDL